MKLINWGKILKLEKVKTKKLCIPVTILNDYKGSKCELLIKMVSCPKMVQVTF